MNKLQNKFISIQRYILFSQNQVKKFSQERLIKIRQETLEKMKKMSEYYFVKKILYFKKIFDVLINQKEKFFNLSIRESINNLLKQNHILSIIQYDADLTNILEEYVFTQKLHLKEQYILEIISQLLKEKLVEKSLIDKLIYQVKRKKNISKLSEYFDIIDDKNLIDILSQIYPYNQTYAESVQELYQELLFDIQNYQNFNLETEEKLFFQNAINIIQFLKEIYSSQLLTQQKFLQSSQKTNELNIILNEFYEQEKLSQNNHDILINEEVNLIQQIVSEMNLTQLLGLDQVFVCPYGSLVSGFSQNKSDVDISINTICYMDERLFLKLIYSFMQKYLIQKQIFYSQLELIDSALIPLIVLVKRNKNLEGENKTVKIDICVNNILGCFNSKMLYMISKIHPLISQLGIIIKKWAKSKGLISKKNLSSYAFILIMISFLQEKKYISDSFQLFMECYSLEPEYMTQIKRKKQMNEEFITSLYYVSKVSELKQDLDQFKKNNPNQITIHDIDLATLFQHFIFYYCDSDRERYINIISENKPKYYDKNLFFFIIDPLDRLHNPGERSRVENIHNNIYINEFNKAKHLLEKQDYQSIFQKIE